MHCNDLLDYVRSISNCLPLDCNRLLVDTGPRVHDLLQLHHSNWTGSIALDFTLVHGHTGNVLGGCLIGVARYADDGAVGNNKWYGAILQIKRDYTDPHNNNETPVESERKYGGYVKKQVAEKRAFPIESAFYFSIQILTSKNKKKSRKRRWFHLHNQCVCSHTFVRKDFKIALDSSLVNHNELIILDRRI